MQLFQYKILETCLKRDVPACPDTAPRSFVRFRCCRVPLCNSRRAFRLPVPHSGAAAAEAPTGCCSTGSHSSCRCPLHPRCRPGRCPPPIKSAPPETHPQRVRPDTWLFPPALGTQVRQGGVQFRLRHIGLVQQNVQLLLCCLTSLLPVRRQDHVCMDMQSHETYKIGKASKIILASALFWT